MKVGQPTGVSSGTKCAGCSWVVVSSGISRARLRLRGEEVRRPRPGGGDHLIEPDRPGGGEHPDPGGIRPDSGHRRVVPDLGSLRAGPALHRGNREVGVRTDPPRRGAAPWCRNAARATATRPRWDGAASARGRPRSAAGRARAGWPDRRDRPRRFGRRNAGRRLVRVAATGGRPVLPGQRTDGSGRRAGKFANCRAMHPGCGPGRTARRAQHDAHAAPVATQRLIPSPRRR